MALKQKLSKTTATRLSKDGVYGAGNNLSLLIRGDGKHKSWVFRYVHPITKKRINIGLGSFAKTKYEDVLNQAYELVQALNRGEDPRTILNAKTELADRSQTMTSLFESYIAHRAKTISERHAKDFIRLAIHNMPKLMKQHPKTITEADIINALSSIWLSKAETADRLLSRLKMVLTHHDYELNWNKITKALPQRIKEVKHLTAVDYTKAQAEYQYFSQANTQSSLAVAFLLLTALRSSTGRHITKAMVKSDVIEVPHHLFKATVAKKKSGEVFRLPITPQLRALINKSLQQQAELGITSDYLFANRDGNALSDVALSKLTKKHGYTVHGFRSTFRDWCAETKQDFWASEKQLSHAVLNSTQSSYLRSDLLAERTNILNQYHQYLSATNVVQLKRKA